MDKQYTRSEQLIIYLDSIDIPEKKIQELINLVDDFGSLLTNFEMYKTKVSKILTDEQINQISTSSEKNLALAINENLTKYNISAVTILSSNYPEKLKELNNPPVILYTKGDQNLLNEENVLAVVGTRKPSFYGKNIAEKFVEEFVSKNLLLVSGLAYGIDSIVARVSVEKHKKTIAVLAGGLDKIYPPTNVNLANEIVKNGGLLVSKYHVGLPPLQYKFPERNEIISAISDGVLVIEAGNKSGSLITANFALDQGKDLYIVPGNLNNPQCEGSNRLLYEMPHALVIEPKNILEKFGLSSESKQVKSYQPSFEEKIIIDALSEGELDFDNIVEKTKMEAKKLNILLTTMEISEIIKKCGPNSWTLF